MLMNWSSPFPYEESQINMLKKKARPPKLVSARQLHTDNDDKNQYKELDQELDKDKEKDREQDDNELGDYNPPKDKLKHKKMNTVTGNESYNMYQNPFTDQDKEEPIHTSYPIYDKPFEYTPTSSKDTQLLEKLNYMIYLLEEQKDEKTGQVTEELILDNGGVNIIGGGVSIVKPDEKASKQEIEIFKQHVHVDEPHVGPCTCCVIQSSLLSSY
jgi:hypothetical protein